MKVREILDITKGQLIIGNENLECENFSKDTRTIQEGDIYIGIKGETFDGSQFWSQALDNGAEAVKYLQGKEKAGRRSCCPCKNRTLGKLCRLYKSTPSKQADACKDFRCYRRIHRNLPPRCHRAPLLERDGDISARMSLRSSLLPQRQGYYCFLRDRHVLGNHDARALSCNRGPCRLP